MIELFQKINHLRQDEQPPCPSLPVYKILNFESHDASIWEYIEGKSPSCDVKDFVPTIADERERERVRASAEHLESVCRTLGVSDLHFENIIVRSTAPTKPSFEHEIVPIDLESLQFGKGTGMYYLNFQPPPLSDQERLLIDQCRERLRDVRVRYVPMGTGGFEGALSDYRLCAQLTKSLIQQITNDGYSLIVPRERLEFLMLQDLVRKDVPYCVMQGDQIYWEPKHEVVAKK